MSYVRRQRLSWARIKLSCLLYLYFKYKSKLIFILVFSSWVLTLWITFFHLVVLITTAWFLKDIVYFSMYFFILNLLVGTLFILAQQVWFVNTFLNFFYLFFVSIFCFSCRNRSVFYHHFFKLSTCFFNFFKNFFNLIFSDKMCCA